MNVENRPSNFTTLHIVTTTRCNAWDLKKTVDSPGVCLFCYRESEKVNSSLEKGLQLLSEIKKVEGIKTLVFTGGDPLFGENPLAVELIIHASKMGFKTNIHTNGLYLKKYFERLNEFVDLFSLPIDGHNELIADWYRGVGYFNVFKENIEMLIANKKHIAFNSFISSHNLNSIDDLAEYLNRISIDTKVSYWLLSQYRSIGRPSSKKENIYTSDSVIFRKIVNKLNTQFPQLNIYAQPTRELNEPYPFRAWLLADGTLTYESGSVQSSRTIILGNVLDPDNAGLQTMLNFARQDYLTRINELKIIAKN